MPLGAHGTISRRGRRSEANESKKEMIHYVITEVDRGEPIVVEYVDLRSGESLDDLTQRVHDVEHGAIVKGTGIAIARLWEERRKHEQAP
jgi:folate-dependent phosphoribosylglycinamide formyltransferase PurN